MPVMGVARFERFFRKAASLDVDKSDLKRYNEFLDRKVYDLFVVAKAAAKANRRDVIEPQDLPITKGIQECAREFHKLDEELDIVPLLEQLLAWPPLDIAISELTEAMLPEIVGGMSIALGRAFKVVHPHLKNPGSAEWEQAFVLFDLLL
jgi:histone H3/H4